SSEPLSVGQLFQCARSLIISRSWTVLFARLAFILATSTPPSRIKSLAVFSGSAFLPAGILAWKPLNCRHKCAASFQPSSTLCGDKPKDLAILSNFAWRCFCNCFAFPPGNGSLSSRANSACGFAIVMPSPDRQPLKCQLFDYFIGER